MTEKILSKVQNIEKEKAIFWTLVSILLLCSGFYMYFINATVHNVVTRQNIEAETSNLSLQIGSEEFKYISKRNSVTLALANSLGFKEVSVKKYITRGPSSKFAFLSR
jgi:hypothetical protein